MEEIIIQDTYIRFRVKTKGGFTDVVSYSNVNLTGNLSIKQGVKRVVIEAREGYVWIGT